MISSILSLTPPPAMEPGASLPVPPQVRQIAAKIAKKIAATMAATISVFLCAIAIFLLSNPATAAELAILRNGYSIRHEHHLVMGTTTRLYLGADDSSFTDVRSEERRVGKECR